MKNHFFTCTLCFVFGSGLYASENFSANLESNTKSNPKAVQEIQAPQHFDFFNKGKVVFEKLGSSVTAASQKAGYILEKYALPFRDISIGIACLILTNKACKVFNQLDFILNHPTWLARRLFNFPGN